jgi:hypothetical protein
MLKLLHVKLVDKLPERRHLLQLMP